MEKIIVDNAKPVSPQNAPVPVVVTPPMEKEIEIAAVVASVDPVAVAPPAGAVLAEARAAIPEIAPAILPESTPSNSPADTPPTDTVTPPP